MAKSAPPVRLVSVEDHLRSGGAVDLPGALVLDDCQEILAKPKLRLTLRLLLERRVRGGRPTMLAFTLPRPTRALGGLLPLERSWLVTTLQEPAAQERAALIEQMAAAEGLALSPRLVRIVATRMHGNGRTLSGALKRLRLAGATWLDAEATLRACGLLDPFFADNPGWDLKGKVARLAERNRVRFGRVLPADLAIYTLLRVAGLAEADVARSFGIEPSAAYLRAGRFASEATAAREPRATSSDLRSSSSSRSSRSNPMAFAFVVYFENPAHEEPERPDLFDRVRRTRPDRVRHRHRDQAGRARDSRSPVRRDHACGASDDGRCVRQRASGGRHRRRR